MMTAAASQPSWRRVSARLARDRRGSAAVEFSLVAPALLLLVLGMLESGRALWTQNALNYAVEQAARCYAVGAPGCTTPALTQSFAAGVSGAKFPSSAFTVSNAACGFSVTASYSMSLLIPHFGITPTLTAQSCFPN